MLKQVRLKNFQSHKDTTIELVSGVNTFIGTSDHGKSSIMRAINLVADNSPRGTQFISHWIISDKGKPVENTEVELVFEDGRTVRRVKGVDNLYVTDDGEEFDYAAFGSSVPDEILEIINLSDTNIQKQEQNFFLFAESAGEVIRRINKYTNLDMIDTALSRAESDSRKNKSEIKTAVSQLADVRDKKTSFEILDTLIPLHEKAQETFDALEPLAKKREKIIGAAEKVLNLEDRLSDFVDLTRCDRILVRAEENAASLRELGKKIASLTAALNKVDAVESRLKNLPPEIDFTDVNTLVSALGDKAERVDGLVAIIEKYEKLSSKLGQVTAKLDELHEEYHEEMGDVCPLCGHKIDG